MLVLVGAPVGRTVRPGCAAAERRSCPIFVGSASNDLYDAGAQKDVDGSRVRLRVELDLTDHNALARAQARVPDPTGEKLAAEVR